MNTRMLLSPVLEAKPDSNIGADEFDHLLVECVEQTLTDLLGWKVREGLLDYLARHDRLARHDIPGHPRELSMLLHETLDKGGIEIEKCIMRRLFAILGWEYKETSNFNFANQVEEARASFLVAYAHRMCLQTAY